MRTIAAILRFCLLIIEKVTWELALLAALFSSTEGGTYFDRIVGGMMDNFRAIYGFGRAYVANVKFADFMVAFDAAIEEGLQAVNLNVETNSRMVLLGMLATFISWKIFAYVLRFIRKKLLKPRRGGGETVKKPPQREASGGKTYQQLYDKDQPSAHTPPNPHTPSTPQG